MPINFFQTINSVLTRGVSSICDFYGISEDDALERMRHFLADNSHQYYSDSPQLTYDDPLCRIAYLYAYVGAHANLVDNALCRLLPLRSFITSKIGSSGRIEICSLGGGPGSELLGFVKFIERNRNPNDIVDINFTLLDNVPEWDESWQALVNGLEDAFATTYGPSRREWPVVVQRSFLSRDLTSVQDFANLPTRFRDVEIYVLNHTVSELVAHQQQFEEVFRHIASRASGGAFFLFIDRNQSEVVDWVNRLAETGELVCLRTVAEQTNMDRDEQAADLGDWCARMDRYPKLTWNAYYALSVKADF